MSKLGKELIKASKEAIQYHKDCNDLVEQTQKLKAQLAIAKNQLEYECAGQCIPKYNPCIARQAIQQLEIEPEAVVEVAVMYSDNHLESKIQAYSEWEDPVDAKGTLIIWPKDPPNVGKDTK